jgi:HK97 family phage prohead protease
LTIRAVRKEAREADFVCSTDGVDSCGEIVEQSWDLRRYTKNPVVLWAHNAAGTGDGMPLGSAKNVGIVDGALCATLCFVSAAANPKAEQVWQGIQEGAIRAVSVGFSPRSVRTEIRAGKETLVLCNNELFEISVVPLPANEDALRREAAQDTTRIRALRALPVSSPAVRSMMDLINDTKHCDELRRQREDPPVPDVRDLMDADDTDRRVRRAAMIAARGASNEVPDMMSIIRERLS